MAWIHNYQAGVRWLPFWPLHSHFRRWGGPRRRTGSDHPCSGSAGPQQPQRRPTGARGRPQATGTHPEVADFQEIWTRWVESGVFGPNEENRHQGVSCTHISSICAKIVFRVIIRAHWSVLSWTKVPRLFSLESMQFAGSEMHMKNFVHHWFSQIGLE